MSRQSSCWLTTPCVDNMMERCSLWTCLSEVVNAQSSISLPAANDSRPTMDSTMERKGKTRKRGGKVNLWRRSGSHAVGGDDVDGIS